MKKSFFYAFAAILLSPLQCVHAQAFVNLNFEQARFHVSPTPTNTYGNTVEPSLAFSGWTVGNASTNGYTFVAYNTLSLGSPAAILMGPNFPNASDHSPLQGCYSALLIYFGYAGGPPTMSRTGLVPANAQSINFLVGGIYESSAAMTLNGVDIPLIPITGGRLAGDISAFAGSTVQLTISTLNVNGRGGWLYFDDVRFSSLPVPEPTVLSLSCFCVLFQCWQMRVACKRSDRKWSSFF